MSKQEVKAPSVGESITEVSILKWHKTTGSSVKNGELLLEIESDKATVEVIAEANGVLEILTEAGSTIPVGATIAWIDPAGTPQNKDLAPQKPVEILNSSSSASLLQAGPAARKIAEEKNISLEGLRGSGKDGRVTKGDLLNGIDSSEKVQNSVNSEPKPQQHSTVSRPGERRVPMSRIRKRIAERLLSAQQNAAILTTFNEVDLSAVMEVRKLHKDAFKAKYGVNLGFMSFFTRASCLALQSIPELNAYIDGEDIIYHDSCAIGIAVGTEKGLVVPVLKNAEKLSFAEIEKSIFDFAKKAQSGKLGIDEMTGGTFTISNGGVYGSMLSTPILNPPQSGILGMHNIQERPIALQGQVVIRPMMYLALSYDHRIIDGKEAVTFLVKLKQSLENPQSLGLDFI